MVKVERKMCLNCPDMDRGICHDRCIVGLVYDAEDLRLRKIRRNESRTRHRKINGLKVKC